MCFLLRKETMLIRNLILVNFTYFFCFVFGEVIVSSYHNNESTGIFIADYTINKGFPFEIHRNIKTEDGYLLQIHRIKHGRTNTNNGTNPIAFLMHPLGANSDCWLIGSAKKALALLLADNGYDVWLGNVRGTKYSKKHVNLHDNQTKFWDFSWHEIGLYDLPASLNYVLNYTKQEQLFYVGHSQGGTAFFVMNSFYPDMNRVVKLMFGLAPGVFYDRDGYVFTNASANFLARFLTNMANGLGFTHFDYHAFKVCNRFPRPFFLDMELFCSLTYHQFAGINYHHLDKEQKALVDATYLDAVPIKSVLHYLQLSATRSFKQYDYGFEKNLELYGTEQPPLYNLNKTTCPVGIFYGIADTLVTPSNSRRLIRELPNVVAQQFITEPDFTHFDMLFHRNIDKILYNRLLSIMDNYN